MPAPTTLQWTFTEKRKDFTGTEEVDIKELWYSCRAYMFCASLLEDLLCSGHMGRAKVPRPFKENIKFRNAGDGGAPIFARICLCICVSLSNHQTVSKNVFLCFFFEKVSRQRSEIVSYIVIFCMGEDAVLLLVILIILILSVSRDMKQNAPGWYKMHHWFISSL